MRTRPFLFTLLPLALAACSPSESKQMVSLSGAVTAVGSAATEGAGLTLYGAKDFITGAKPLALAQASVGADGAWSAGAVDVSAVDDAVVAVSAGTETLLPTLSGVVDYAHGQAKADLASAHLFVVPRATAQAIATAMGRADLPERGFVLGLVTDGHRPLAGVTVTAGSTLALDVVYPSASFTSVSRSGTSANGLFVVAADPALLFLDLTAHKAGRSFAPAMAPLKAGLCSVAVVLEAAAPAPVPVEVAGLVTAIGGSAAGVSVELLAPTDVATGASVVALDGGIGLTSDAGLFHVGPVDVADVSQGLLARVAGTGLVPTISGVTAWASEADADKVGTSHAHLFAVSAAIAQALAAATGRPSLTADGFVVGLVTDGTAPVAGATVARVDGQALRVLYPDATFSSLSGTSTSPSGLFVLPATAGLSLVPIAATKGTASFGPVALLPRAGTCFVPVLHP